MRDVFDQRVLSDQQCAITAKCLAEGDQQQWRGVRIESGSGHAAASFGTEHADRVRLVDVQQSILIARDRRQFAQRGDIAIHAEHAIGRDQQRAIGVRLGLASRAVGIAMRITHQLRLREPRGIEQAGVVELVLQADIAWPQQRLHDREIRHVAAAEQ